MATTITTAFTITREYDQLQIMYNGDTEIQAWNITDISFTTDPNNDFIYLGNMFTQFKILYTASVSPTASNLSEYLTKLIKLCDNDNNFDVSAGIVANKKAVNINGLNNNIGTNPEDIWVVGGDYNFLTGATILDIISADANDDASGLGARTVFIDGLDATFIGITEIVSLVSVTSASTVNMFSRVNFMNVETTGTYHGANYDDITAEADGKIIARIDGVYNNNSKGTSDYGTGRTSLGVYTIPKDKTAFITSISICNDSNRKGIYTLYKFENADDTSSPVNSREVIWRCNNISGGLVQQFQQFLRVPEKSDIWMRCSTTGGNSSFSMNLTIILVDNIVP